MDIVIKGLLHKKEILEEILEWHWGEEARKEIEIKILQTKQCLKEYDDRHLEGVAV